MRVSDIMTNNVFTLLSDDTISEALNIMHNNRFNQIPILDKYKNYQGMVFAKDILDANIMNSSKLKNLSYTSNCYNR